MFLSSNEFFLNFIVFGHRTVGAIVLHEPSLLPVDKKEMDQICITTCANEKSPASPPPLFLMLVFAFSNLFLFVWNTCHVLKNLAFLCKHCVIQHNALLYFQWYFGFYVFIKIVEARKSTYMLSPRFIAYIIRFLLQWASISVLSRTSAYMTKPLLLLHTCTYIWNRKPAFH